MFEHNTDRMFWTIAVLILGATLLMIGNKAFPTAQASIMTTISQNIKTGNKAAKTLSGDLDGENEPSNTTEAKQKNFAELKNYDYTYNSDGSINLKKYKGSAKNIDIPKWGPAKNSNDIKDAVKVTTLNGPSTTFIDDNGPHSSNEGTFEEMQISSVNIPNSIINIGPDTFSYNNLTSVIIPDSVTNIDTEAFSYNKLNSLKLSNSLNYIGDAAFEFNKLTTVIIPDSVRSIGNSAFYYNSINSLTLGNSIINIKFSAFEENKLTSVTLPKSVINVDPEAFDSDTTIKK